MDEIEELRRRCERQSQEITKLNEVLHRKNVELDALHMVWCDGGCVNGVHRWTEEPVTEEIVVAAERNTTRLRRWFDVARFRLGRYPTASDWHRDYAQRLEAKVVALSTENDPAVERGAERGSRVVLGSQEERGTQGGADER